MAMRGLIYNNATVYFEKIRDPVTGSQIKRLLPWRSVSCGSQSGWLLGAGRDANSHDSANRTNAKKPALQDIGFDRIEEWDDRFFSDQLNNPIRIHGYNEHSVTALLRTSSI